MKILLVEDDLTFAQILVGFLEKNGHSADVKCKVKDAIQALDNDMQR